MGFVELLLTAVRLDFSIGLLLLLWVTAYGVLSSLELC